MIDPKPTGDRIVLAAENYGQWRDTFEREDDAEAVRSHVAQHIDLELFEVVREGFDVVVLPRKSAPNSGPNLLDEDSGYGPDSYFGRSMQRDD